MNTKFEHDEIVFGKLDTDLKGMIMAITYHTPEHYTYTVQWIDGSMGQHKEIELIDEDEAEAIRLTSNN